MGRKRSDERQQFLWDVFITALCGGVNSWSCVDDVQSEQPDPNDAFTFRYTEATLYCSDGGPVPDECCLSTKENPIGVCPGHKLDVDVIAKGMGLAALSEAKGTEQNIGWHYSQRRHVIQANRENDAGGVDAFDASCIVQLGIFGTVVCS